MREDRKKRNRRGQARRQDGRGRQKHRHDAGKRKPFDSRPGGARPPQRGADLRPADQLIREQDVREVVFDFSGTTFCDSSGIGMLMGRYKIMQALGGSVRAVKVQDRVERILLLSGVMRVIPVERI